MKALACTCPAKGCAIHDRPAPERRYPWAVAMQIAEEIVYSLGPGCERIEIAGSLRRKKPDVGDIEILYIPTTQEEPDGLFGSRVTSLADGRIEGLIRALILEKRHNAKGAEMFGEKNKLLRHVASGIPVDLFAATADNWWNYLVCRTGPAELNQRIAGEAKRIGWKWHPYGSGFTTQDGSEFRVDQERDVFEFVGLPYAEPGQRR